MLKLVNCKAWLWGSIGCFSLFTCLRRLNCVRIVQRFYLWRTHVPSKVKRCAVTSHIPLHLFPCLDQDSTLLHRFIFLFWNRHTKSFLQANLSLWICLMANIVTQADDPSASLFVFPGYKYSLCKCEPKFDRAAFIIASTAAKEEMFHLCRPERLCGLMKQRNWNFREGILTKICRWV